MKRGCIFLFIFSQMFMLCAHAKPNAISPTHQMRSLPPMMLGMTGAKNLGFMTARDMLRSTPSGITIKNVSNAPLSLTGIYIQTLYSNNDGGGPLSANYGSPVGALWSNISLGTSSPGNTTIIGANFLYNMIMNYVYQTVTSNVQPPDTIITPGTADFTLPGGGSVPGNPWTLFLGVVNNGVVTSTTSVSSANDLVYIAQLPDTTSYAQQICVSCDDTQQTCIVSASTSCFASTSSAVQDVPCNLSGSTGCATGVTPP